MIMIIITITIMIMNVEYIWLTSLNAKQVSSAVCALSWPRPSLADLGPFPAPPREKTFPVHSWSKHIFWCLGARKDGNDVKR